MQGLRSIKVWPTTLRGRFSASLALSSVLLFIIIYVVTSLITGYQLWPTGPEPMIQRLVPLGLGGLALIAGLLVGLALARDVRIPIERSVEHIRQQGVAAIEGRAHDEPMPTEHEPPFELQELSQTIEQLLRQLSLRQASLQEVTQRALDSEQTFRAVVNASSEVKLLMSDGIVEVANPAAVAFLGRPLGSLLGESVSAALAGFLLTTEFGKPIEADELVLRVDDDPLLVRCIGSDGEERWAECMVTRPKGDSRLSLLTVRDVTERRALEELRSEVVSVVSHDLRAPLTVVSGYLEMLTGDVPDERRIQIITKARAATARMAEMLEDLLGTARAENGLLSNRWAPVHLGELAEDAASSIPSHAGHELIIEQRADARVLGDVGRIRQALINLLMNAVKHTPEGTRISLAVDAMPEHALLIVEDDGKGVPEQHRETIFERYARLDDDSGYGTGLGLYIVKTVAENHGGDAYVEDGTNGGARFVIRLPLMPENAD